MSFILDALKKSEAERQRQAGPALLEMRVVAPQRRLPLWAVAVGVLLLINIVVLGWFAWHRAPAAAPTAPASAAGNAAVIAGVAGANQAPAANAQVAAPAAPQPRPIAAPDGVAPASDSVGQSGQQSLPDVVDAAAAATEADNPADLQPAVHAAQPATRPAATGSGLQTYAELSGKLPELRLDLHVYAARPADRYAFINMHKVREGDVTPEGVRVAEITNDGVVLDYRGTEFLLGHQ